MLTFNLGESIKINFRENNMIEFEIRQGVKLAVSDNTKFSIEKHSDNGWRLIVQDKEK